MGMEQKTGFTVDKSKCIRCGKCNNTCSEMVIEFGPDGWLSADERVRTIRLAGLLALSALPCGMPGRRDLYFRKEAGGFPAASPKKMCAYMEKVKKHDSLVLAGVYVWFSVSQMVVKR